MRDAVIEPDELAMCISALHARGRMLRAEADLVERNYGNLGEVQAEKLRQAAERFESCFRKFCSLGVSCSSDGT